MSGQLVQAVIFLLVASGAATFATLRFKKLYQLMVAHQGKAPEFGQMSERAIDAFIHVIGQKAVLQKRGAGIMHAVIFWGFLVITIGTLEQFTTTLHPILNFEFLGSVLYPAFIGLSDFFTFAVLLAIGVATYRRLILRPPGLGVSKDANNILIFTSSLMASILLMNAFHILGGKPWYAGSFIISSHLAGVIQGLGLSDQTYSVLSVLFKWIHMILVMGFGMYIPGSKHLHVIAAAPNSFLRPLSRQKGMKPIDFTNENMTQYGVAKVTDLSWKDALDYYACTECGRCQDLCPAYNTQKPLSPKALIHDLKENLYLNQGAVLQKKYVKSQVYWTVTLPKT